MHRWLNVVVRSNSPELATFGEVRQRKRAAGSSDLGGRVASDKLDPAGVLSYVGPEGPSSSPALRPGVLHGDSPRAGTNPKTTADIQVDPINTSLLEIA